eukprot:m.60449 g.60449  ORF g.60449 m.60449 type:complete len:908 (+) comp11322_c0_seq1:103-2826(+)
MHISKNFDGGAIQVQNIKESDDGAVVDLALTPDAPDHGSPFMQWFYFRAVGIQGLESVFYTIENAGKSTYPVGWVGYKVYASWNRQKWFRIQSTEYDGDSLTWSHSDIQGGSCYYAYYPPYSQERLLDKISTWQLSPRCDVNFLGLSGDGAAMDVLCIGMPPPPAPLLRDGAPNPKLAGSTHRDVDTEVERKMSDYMSKEPARRVTQSGLVIPDTENKTIAKKLLTDIDREKHILEGAKKMLILQTEAATKDKKQNRAKAIKIQQLSNEIARSEAKINALELELRGLTLNHWFGQSLAVVSEASGNEVPMVVKSCIQALRSTELTEEGIFRVPGESGEIQKLIYQFECAMDPLKSATNKQNRDNVHCIASCLKQYFRDLPEPLLATELYDDWMKVGSNDISDPQSRKTAINLCQSALQKLPHINRQVLSLLLPFLLEVSSKSQVNKMSVENLATVFGPNLLRKKQDESDVAAMAAMLKNTGTTTKVIQLLIEEHEALFACDDDAEQSEVTYNASIEDKSLYVNIDPDAGVSIDWDDNMYLSQTISREFAEEFLAKIKLDGTFLVRISSTGNPGSKYTLTFWADGNVQNYRIASSNGKLVVKQVEYDNLKDLIKNFQETPLFKDVYLRYPINTQNITTIEAICHLFEPDSQELRDRVIQILEQTRENNAVQIQHEKLTCWVIARQHPGETQASWYVEGFLDRLLDLDDPLSESLLHIANFYVVPNMNPDGSKRGYQRTNAFGRNLNREWSNPDKATAPEVFHCRNAMEATGVDFSLDIHSEEDLPYVFCSKTPLGIPGLTSEQERLYHLYCAKLAEVNPDFQTQHGYPMPEKGKANMSVCCAWVAQRFKCVALTQEQPYKDNALLPNTNGWSIGRCQNLGRSALDAIMAITPGLQANQIDKNFLETLV